MSLDGEGSQPTMYQALDENGQVLSYASADDVRTSLDELNDAAAQKGQKEKGEGEKEVALSPATSYSSPETKPHLVQPTETSSLLLFLRMFASHY